MRHPTLDDVLDLPSGTVAGLVPPRRTADDDEALRTRLADLVTSSQAAVTVDDVRIRRLHSATRRLAVTCTLRAADAAGAAPGMLFLEQAHDEVVELRVDGLSTSTAARLRAHFNDADVQARLFAIFNDPALARSVAAHSLAHAADRLEQAGDELSTLLLQATADVVTAVDALETLHGRSGGATAALARDWHGTLGQLLAAAAQLDHGGTP